MTLFRHLRFVDFLKPRVCRSAFIGSILAVNMFFDVLTAPSASIYFSSPKCQLFPWTCVPPPKQESEEESEPVPPQRITWLAPGNGPGKKQCMCHVDFRRYVAWLAQTDGTWKGLASFSPIEHNPVLQIPCSQRQPWNIGENWTSSSDPSLGPDFFFCVGTIDTHNYPRSDCIKAGEGEFRLHCDQ